MKKKESKQKKKWAREIERAMYYFIKQQTRYLACDTTFTESERGPTLRKPRFRDLQ